MNPTLFEIGVAIVMVTVSIALVAWSSRYMAAASERRMMHMLASAGVASEVVRHGDTEAIMYVGLRASVWRRHRPIGLPNNGRSDLTGGCPLSGNPADRSGEGSCHINGRES